MSFEVKYNGAIVIVGEYDEESCEVAIEDVVDPETGEVLTDDWFEDGSIRDRELTAKIKDHQNEQRIDNFLNQL